MNNIYICIKKEKKKGREFVKLIFLICFPYVVPFLFFFLGGWRGGPPPASRAVRSILLAPAGSSIFQTRLASVSRSFAFLPILLSFLSACKNPTHTRLDGRCSF